MSAFNCVPIENIQSMDKIKMFPDIKLKVFATSRVPPKEFLKDIFYIEKKSPERMSEKQELWEKKENVWAIITNVCCAK